MRNYVNIIYIPGSCGNFVARCLNLLDGFYCFVNPNSTKEEIINLSIEEKFKFLSYENILKKVSKDFSKIPRPGWWHDEHEYTNSIAKFYSHPSIEHVDTPEDSTIVLDTHINNYYKHVIPQQESFIGDNDRLYNFYIDFGTNYELIKLNFQYKLTDNLDFFNQEVNLFHEKIMIDNNFNSIDLENILKSSRDCVKEIQKICQVIGHVVSDTESSYITQLYDQWIPTVVTQDRFELFRKQFLGRRAPIKLNMETVSTVLLAQEQKHQR